MPKVMEQWPFMAGTMGTRPAGVKIGRAKNPAFRRNQP
jgi:hypothetical protein